MSDNESTEIPCARRKHEHVALSEASSQKINAWLEQVNIKKKGVKISRKDFINWFIEKSPDNLSGGDLASLIGRFYNEAAFLRQLLRDVKQAKAEGKSEAGFELVLKTKRPDVKRDSAGEDLPSSNDPT